MIARRFRFLCYMFGNDVLILFSGCNWYRLLVYGFEYRLILSIFMFGFEYLLILSMFYVWFPVSFDTQYVLCLVSSIV